MRAVADANFPWVLLYFFTIVIWILYCPLKMRFGNCYISIFLIAMYLNLCRAKKKEIAVPGFRRF